MCGCNKPKNVVGRSSSPRRNIVSAQSTTSIRRNSPQVQAQSVPEKKGMTADRRQRERERREVLLNKLGRL